MQKEELNSEIIKKEDDQLIFIGVATIAVSFLVSSGYWDIFDFLISCTMLLIMHYKIWANICDLCFKRVIIIWLSFSTITTAVLISLVAIYGSTFSNNFAASVSIENIKVLEASKKAAYPEEEGKSVEENKPINYFQRQFIWQTSIFSVSGSIWFSLLFFKIKSFRYRITQPIQSLTVKFKKRLN